MEGAARIGSKSRTKSFADACATACRCCANIGGSRFCNDPSPAHIAYLSFVQQLAEMSGDGGEAVLLRGFHQVRGHV